MTPEQIAAFAQKHNTTVTALRASAMRFLLAPHDPQSSTYRFAWDVWTHGEAAELSETQARRAAAGYIFYPAADNAQPIRCPHCHTVARLLGGKRLVYTCPRCDCTQVDYQPHGGDGFWLLWSDPTGAAVSTYRELEF